MPNSGKAAKRGSSRGRATTKPRPVNRPAWRFGPLASRGGRITAAITLVTALAVCGLTAALAGTATHAPSAVPHPAVAAPVTATEPGALPVAEPHTGAGRMSHDLIVRVQRWAGGQAGCTPALRALADRRSTHPVAGGCGATPQLTAATPPGYSPQQLRAYLRLRGSGAGQTVTVVDAYDNPYITRDITTYSKQFGLPLPCPATGTAPGCFRFSVVHPYGFAGVDAGWAMESDLDVQMVHAIAPKASIELVEAYDNSSTSLQSAISYAAGAQPSPAVITNSWGGSEFAGETVGNQQCALASTLCVFSSGDAGNPGQYPAYNPYVLSVGGTTLGLTPHGTVSSEAAWCCTSDSGGVGSGTGGGVSQYEPRPSYQDGVNSYQGRGIPDVTFDADPYTGVAVYDTVGVLGQNGWFEVGGTSAGAPAWAGIVAAADQLRATAGKAPLHGAGFQAQSLIYGMRHATGFGDIAIGVDNATECTSPVQACRTQPGYDLVTGWGSPRPGIDTALASTP